MIAMAIVLALGVQAWRTVHSHPALLQDRDAILLGLLSAAVVLASFWHLLMARTWMDATHITQAGLWTRRLALADVRRIHVVYVPGLAWLISPRVRLQTASRGSYVFHTSDPVVLARFCELALGVGEDAPEPKAD
jgi:hypothetical protein